METSPKDVQCISHWVARRFNKIDNIISFEDRISIAILNIYTTLNYHSKKAKGTNLSTSIVISAAIQSISRELKKRMKIYFQTNMEDQVYDSRDSGMKNIENRSELKILIKCLNKKDKNIIYLRHWKGWQWREIGKKIGLSECATRARYVASVEHMKNYSKIKYKIKTY